MLYLCVNIKSFYASVECVDRNKDPNIENLIVAKIGPAALAATQYYCLILHKTSFTSLAISFGSSHSTSMFSSFKG